MNQQPNQQPKPERDVVSNAAPAVKRMIADVARQKIPGDPALMPLGLVRENAKTEAMRRIETEAGE